jgi:tetratricopeptide (TPR) repeat protein
MIQKVDKTRRVGYIFCMLDRISEKNKEKLFLLGVFFLAFILRLVYLLQIKSNPHFFSPTMDPLYHDVWAQNIAEGNWFGGKVFFRAPFYAYFLALVYKIFGHNYIIPRLIQHLIGSFSCILVYFLAKRIFNRKVAVVASLIAASYGMLLYFEDELLLDSFLVFFDLLLILFLLRAKNNPKFLNWFVCGIILGFSAITRPNILFFIPFVWLWIFLVFIHEKRLREILTFCMIFLIGSALMIFPITLRNYLVGKDFVLIASQGGINFLIGNNQNADGMSAVFYKEDWQYRDFEYMAEKEAGRSLKPSEVSNFYYKKGVKFLVDEPEKGFKLWVKKFYVFWNKFEVSNNQDVYFFRRYSSLIRILPIGFWFIGPLGLVGMVLSMVFRKELPGRRKDVFLPIIFVFSYMITVVMFFVTARFRFPIIPFLIIFSAFALVWLWQKFSKRELSKIALFFLLLFPLFILTNSNAYHLSAKDFSQAYFSLGNAYLKAGKLDLALQEYDEALSRNPHLSRVHMNKGIIFLRRKEYARAEKEFELELEKNPQEDRAYNDLAAVYLTLKLYDQAIQTAQKAIELKVYYPEAYMNLALAYKGKGDYLKAKVVVESGLRNVHPFPEANYLLGEIYQAQGEPDSARQAYEKVLSLNPFSDIAYNLETLSSKKDLEEEYKDIKANTYFNLGTIDVQQGEIDLAEFHLKKAISLKPDFAEALANLGTLYSNTRRFSEAITQLQRAINLDPQNEVYHYNLGLAYAKNNQLEEAKEEFEQSLQIDPNFKEAQEKLFLADSLLKTKIPINK